MNLLEAARLVKEFVSKWTDQELAEVLAFNDDGKMSYTVACSCLFGVRTALNERMPLHQIYDDCPMYYRHMVAFNALRKTPDWIVEYAYRDLAIDGSKYDETLRKLRFSSILHEVMGEREQAKVKEEEHELVGSR